MDFKAVIDQALLRLRELIRGGTKSASPGEELAELQFLTVEKQQYVFGLDWRFYGDRKDLRKTLGSSQKSGLTHYAVTTTEDMVGLGYTSLKGSGKSFSASLQIAEAVSQGGVELFVLKLGEDLYSITALHDSRPVAGFDRIGTGSEILSLAGEFQLQQIGHNIRQAGNSGRLENEDPIKLSSAFTSPSVSSRLKKLPNYRKQFLFGIGLLLVLSLAWLIWWWLNMESLRVAQEKRIREQDPNFIYERVVASGVNSIGVHAQAQLQSWRAAIKDVPLDQNGWSLNKINCVPQQCEAFWERGFGNYKEFYTLPLTGVVRTTETQTADNPAVASIQTILKVIAPQVVVGQLKRGDLPKLPDALQTLASQLQDMALLPSSAVQLKAPELFPATPGIKIQQIKAPVVRGEWSITHELWSLGDLEWKGKVLVAESLLIYREEKTNNWLYTLTGKYYAKGKDF